MSVKIYKNTKIFIACPANFATGGPELLHQLGYHLINDLKIDAYMFYYNYNSDLYESPVHNEYKKYKIPYIKELSNEDLKQNIMITPEVYDALIQLNKYKNIRKGIWFLSVDNYYFSRIKKYNYLIQKIISKLLNKTYDVYNEQTLKNMIKKYSYETDKLVISADFYMTNSYRGMKWFDKLKPLYYLSEYINQDFIINIEKNKDKIKKRNIVIYNPKKGIDFTKKIIKFAEDIEFVPIENMTRNEVAELLSKAKVYIDFGNHPGKDRIPREAAISGCCVITGKRGSAKYYEDVPIPDEYKFDDKEENIPLIVEKIKECMNNYADKIQDFELYRNFIKNEKKEFIKDLKKIFVKDKNES